MAFPGGVQTGQTPYAIGGLQESFALPRQFLNPGIQASYPQGSTMGVPPNGQIAGESPNTSINSALAYGQNTATQPPHKQPLFWSFVLAVIGTLILTHAAKLSGTVSKVG